MATTDKTKQDALLADVESRFGEAVVGADRSLDDLSIIVKKERAHDVLSYLKDKHAFDLLLDIAGVDLLKMPEYEQRFELEYMLFSVSEKTRCRVRIRVPETDMDVATVTDLWKSANWGEREAFEFFGFNFVGHPNLKRLLTHHEFQGYPLRKDYPVMKGQWCTTTSVLDDDLNE